MPVSTGPKKTLKKTEIDQVMVTALESVSFDPSVFVTTTFHAPLYPEGIKNEA
jgi:hypothetical protein